MHFSIPLYRLPILKLSGYHCIEIKYQKKRQETGDQSSDTRDQRLQRLETGDLGLEPMRPGTRDQRLEIRDQRIRDQRLETRDQRPETKYLRLENRNKT